MRLQKNAARAAAFLLTGALAAVMVFAVGNNIDDETTAVAGTWADYTSTAWVDSDDARYRNYEVEPGSAEDAPYLIQTAEEFSGIRTFENGEDLAGKYLMLVNDIDLSAHYWDPIELRGGGGFPEGPEDLIPDENEIVHFDGNSRKILGMNIQNAYDKVVNIFTNDEAYYGVTGLFSSVHKAWVADIRLINPVVNLTATSGVWHYGYSSEGELLVDEVIGSVVGISMYSRIEGVHVDGLKLNYAAVFGEYLNGKCTVDVNQNLEPVGEYKCGTFFSPNLIVIGGAVGMASIVSEVRDVSVKNGTVSVRPDVNEADGKRMKALDSGIVIVGGLMGYNYGYSVVLNACNSADVIFSDDGYWLPERGMSYGRVLDHYGMYFGGLVGGLFGEGNIYNSCSHSKLDIDAEISNSTTIGGLAGVMYGSAMVNNYFDGEIVTSNNVVGEVAGQIRDGENASAPVLAANYYLEGKEPYGAAGENVVVDAAAFKTISTVEKLVDDLNAGRALVAADILRFVDLPRGIVDANITAWEVRDGSFPLDCAGYRTAGLVFSDRRVEVPNTGVGRR